MLTVASSTLALALCHRRQDSPGEKQKGEGVASKEGGSKGRFRRARGSASPGSICLQEGFGPSAAAI